MSTAGWDALKAEVGAVNRALVPLMRHDPGDSEVQTLIASHHAVIVRFYEAPAWPIFYRMP